VLALAHDYLLVMRGAERTFAEMADCWPQAPAYTLLYDEAAMAERFEGRDVRVSYLQRLGIKQKGFRYLLPFLPRATERLDVGEYSTIVSSSSAFIHGLRPRPGATHVCYCHSPFRYVWFERERAIAECPRPARPLMNRTLNRIREWDLEASRRVTHYIANSQVTRERIERIYGRESEIIHPPVAVERFAIGEPEDFVLFVGQIVRHKRVDVAIEAAKLAGRPIKIVGDGPDLPRLRELHNGEAVEFLGSVSDERLTDLYARCLALIVPNVEEFGIAAVEAQASGRPVVAVNRGGVRETIIDGVTGALIDDESAEGLAEPLRDLNLDAFDPAAIHAHAQRFSATAFRAAIVECVDRCSGAGS
jgi:glycosyltransferase involved in cell wall biosynthesis